MLLVHLVSLAPSAESYDFTYLTGSLSFAVCIQNRNCYHSVSYLISHFRHLECTCPSVEKNEAWELQAYLVSEDNIVS